VKLLYSLLFASVCFAQSQNVRISQSPADDAFTVITHFTAGNPDYVCKARSTQNISVVTVSAISNANPGIMTATGHGFYYNSSGPVAQHFAAFISGLTGNWLPLNGLHTLYASSADALTTDVDTSTFGAVTGTIVVSTRAPNTKAKVWAVQSLGFDGSSPANPVLQAWAAPLTGSTIAALNGGTTAYAFACTAAPTTYQ
jgi:hypothetical protein